MCCFCLCSGLRLGSTFQLGNRQEVPREPREGPEHLGRRRVPSNNRYSGKVESPSSSCLPSERLSGKPGGPGAPRPSRHRYVPRLVPRDVLEARSGRLGRPRGDEDGLRNVAGEAGGPFCAERRASSSRAERQASSLHCPVHPIKGLLIGRFLPIFTDFSDFLGILLPSKTTTHKTLNTLGVEESSSPRRVLHF